MLSAFMIGSRLAPKTSARLISASGFVVDGEYSSRNVSPALGVRYGSWRGSDGNTGTLTLGPFPAPLALAINIAGYPSHAGERLELVRLDDRNARFRLDVGGNPGENWERRIARVPLSWHGRSVVFVATDSGTQWGDWLGVADVQPAYLDEVVGGLLGSRVRLLGFSVIAALLGFPFLFAAATVCRTLALPRLFIFSVSFLLLGLLAEVTFFVAMFSPIAANATVWGCVLIGSFTTIRGLKREPFRRRLVFADTWFPFLIVAVCAVGCTAILAIAMPASGFGLGSVDTWLTLPVDNALPHILATRVAEHARPEPFAGDWQSSDRPPLQAGFDLMFAALLPFSSDSETRYQALSMVLQATVFGTLFTLCRSTGFSRLRATGLIALAWMSSFFFVNTVFVWPKFLAAAFLAISIVLCFGRKRMSWPLSAVVGMGAGFGLLSHGGIIFTLPALIIAWLTARRIRALQPIAVATATLLLVTAPWSWYQKFYDPPAIGC
jgi:hypothetical protein